MKQTRCYGCDKPIEPEWLPEGEFIVCDECSSDTDKLSVEKLIEKEIKDYEVSYKISGRGSGNYIAGILEGLKIARAHAIDSLSTDEKTVEKLQEQLNTAKNALTEIAYTRQEIWRGGTLVGFEATEDAKIAYDALAAIGWDGCPVGLIVKNGLTKEELEGSGDE